MAIAATPVAVWVTLADEAHWLETIAAWLAAIVMPFAFWYELHYPQRERVRLMREARMLKSARDEWNRNAFIRDHSIKED